VDGLPVGAMDGSYI